MLALAVLASACGESERNVPGGSPTPRASAVQTTARPTAAAPTTSAPAPTTAPTIRPSGTPGPSATSTPPSAASLPPMPTSPPLPSGAAVVVSGAVLFTLAAGAARTFDPLELAQASGKSAPPCASLVWITAWRASDPLTSTFIQQSARSEIGTGRWGTSTLGCSALELRNDGASGVAGELTYTIAAQ